MYEDLIVVLAPVVTTAIVGIIMAYKTGGIGNAIRTTIEHITIIMKTVNEMNKEIEYNKESEINNKYKMNDAVRNFILSGLSEKDANIANKTIDKNEANGIYVYEIILSKRYYKIKYGQIVESGVNP